MTPPGEGAAEEAEPLVRDSPYRPDTWLESANYAVEGVITAVRSERHLRFHLAAAAAVILVSLYLHVSLQDFLILAVAMMLVFYAELMNTALEVVVDLVTLERHPLAKMAKDISAGAVLVTSLLAIIMGYITFGPYLRNLAEVGVGRILVGGEHLTIAALLLTMAAVLYLKVRSGRGTPLRGGLPSGHAAVAASIWAATTLLTRSPLLSGLVGLLAVLVAISRVTMGIHSRLEVALGGLLGALVTLLLFQLLG